MMMTTTIPAIEKVLKRKSLSPVAKTRSLNLFLSYLEFIAPNEINLETGRMIKLLSKHACGLTRDELLLNFYPDYEKASFNKKHSLKVCLEKIIQRSRVQFKKHNLTIFYSKENQRYLVKLI
jgi:hypothetical protein